MAEEKFVSGPGRSVVPPRRGSALFTLDRGLTPAAYANVAAARLRREFRNVVPPPNSVARLGHSLFEGDLRQGLKPLFLWWSYSARLKSCPVTQQEIRRKQSS